MSKGSRQGGSFLAKPRDTVVVGSPEAFEYELNNDSDLTSSIIQCQDENFAE